MYYKSVAKRFFKGFLASFLSTASLLVGSQLGEPKTLSELSIWLQVLAISSMVGGISGGLMAAEKAARWEE